MLALAPISVAAQETVEIDDRVTCLECAIEVGSPVTLAPPTDHVYFASVPPPLVARDREGNYIATRVHGDALIAVFGPDGTYKSSYGRIGGGPGEFAGIPVAMSIGESDVLYVIDQRSLHTLAPRARAQPGSTPPAHICKYGGGSEERNRNSSPIAHGGRSHDGPDYPAGWDDSGKCWSCRGT